MTKVALVLIHYPVLDKNGQIVTSALTNMDIHDIARSARTYGVERFYVATPIKVLRRLSEKIMEHWETGFGSTYNLTRKDALGLVRLEHDLDTTMLAVEREFGALPRLVMTSARDGQNRTPFPALRRQLDESETPHLIVLGTGWGLAPEIMKRADVVLEPVRGPSDYNHLSVRSAAAVILDRLFAAR
jgi:hypothetical protein